MYQTQAKCCFLRKIFYGPLKTAVACCVGHRYENTTCLSLGLRLCTAHPCDRLPCRAMCLPRVQARVCARHHAWGLARCRAHASGSGTVKFMREKLHAWPVEGCPTCRRHFEKNTWSTWEWKKHSKNQALTSAWNDISRGEVVNYMEWCLQLRVKGRVRIM